MRLPLWRLGAYALPAMPLAVLTLPVYIFVPTLYIEGRGLSPDIVGYVLLAARLFDGLTDPIVGHLSDRTPQRFGRRKLWLVIGAPLVMVSAWNLFVPPADAGSAHFALWSFLLTLAWTIAIIPYTAWGAELSGDYHGRTRIVAVREAFVVAGTLVATGTVGILAEADQGDVARGLGAVAVIVAVLMPAAALAALLAVPATRPLSVAPVPFRVLLAPVLRNGPFLRLVAAFLLNGLANGLPATLFLIFVSERIGTPEWGGPLLFIYFLCGIAAVPFWMGLARALGKHRAWSWAMLWACAVFPLVPWLIGPGDIVPFVVITVLTGVSLGADLALPASMQADVVDLDTADCGEERTGLYFALWSLATKLALALAALAFPALLAAGFDPRADSHTPEGLFALSVAYSLVPVGFKLIAIALMWHFPLDEARQTAARARIAARIASA